MDDLDVSSILLGGLAVVLSAVLTTLIVGIFVVWIPPDYFVVTERRSLFHIESPAGRIALRVARNLLGVVLVCVGVILALPGIPGQGVLTVLIGLLFLDVPGKRKLELRLVRRRPVERMINRVRARYGKEPLIVAHELPDDVSEP